MPLAMCHEVCLNADLTKSFPRGWGTCDVGARVTERTGLSVAFELAVVHAVFAPHTTADRVSIDGGQTAISCMKAGWPVADYDRGV
jgi:hypothetical protein